MTVTRPPRRLPAGLHPVWGLLREAAEAAPTRQALADQLGISTSTLQRLLVSGDLPDFGRRATTRELRAWTRTLTRLAIHFGREPRLWIEAAGIQWSEDIAAASRAARMPSGRRRRRGVAYGGAPGDWPSPGASPQGSPLRGCIAAHGTLARNLPLIGQSFFEAYLRRLAGAVDPAVALELEPQEEFEITRELLRPGTRRVHLAAGIPETVREYTRGVSFLPIPGVRSFLAAARVHGPADGADWLSWETLETPHVASRLRVAVVRGSVAESHLRAQCGWSLARLILLEPGGIIGTSTSLADAFDAAPGTTLAFVADEDHLERIAPEFARPGTAGSRLALTRIAGESHRAPSFPLAVAVAPGAGRWVELLRMARDRELFGNAVRTTAGLYAALVAARAFDDVVSGVPFGRRRALEPFAEAGEDFIQAFSHRLVDTMMSAPPVRVGLREPAAGNASITPAGTPVEARRAALVRAALLIPETWVPVYRKVLGDVDPEAIELCQSCSASISHHRGISERYCRFCADERGTLRPRPEVERMLAGWLRMWERGLTADEALEGASRFMSRMPAWSMN